jgi:hypothetical protein
MRQYFSHCSLTLSGSAAPELKGGCDESRDYAAGAGAAVSALGRISHAAWLQLTPTADRIMAHAT